MFTFEFIPNMDCNLDCYFCFASKKDNKERIKPDELLKTLNLIEKISEDDKLFIKIYGGESFLYIDNLKKYLLTIQDFIKHTNMKVLCAIVTNGTIMPLDFLEFLKNKLNYNVSLSFSFEINEEFQNKIRHYKNHPNIGSYDIVTKNLKFYKEFMQLDKVHLQSVITPELLLNVDKYIEFMEKFKNDYQFDLNPMFDDTFSNYDSDILDNMKILFDYYIKKIKEKDADHIGLFQPTRSIISFFMKEYGGTNTHCSAGVNQITLIANGDIYPCSKNYHLGNFNLKYGNIKESIDCLSDKINSQKQLYSLLISYDEKCNECKSIKKFGCLGDCMAERINYNNIHYEWVCKYNEVFGKETLRMVKELKNNEYFLNKIYHNPNASIPGFNEILLSKIKKFN